jgi:hypothetical protein
MPDPPATSSSGPPCGGSQTKVAADGTAELDPVTRPELVRQVRRDLAVGDATTVRSRRVPFGADAIE